MSIVFCEVRPIMKGRSCGEGRACKPGRILYVNKTEICTDTYVNFLLCHLDAHLYVRGMASFYVSQPHQANAVSYKV